MTSPGAARRTSRLTAVTSFARRTNTWVTAGRPWMTPVSRAGGRGAGQTGDFLRRGCAGSLGGQKQRWRASQSATPLW